MTSSILRCYILWHLCNTITANIYFLQLNDIVQLFHNLVVLFDLLFLGQTGRASDQNWPQMCSFKALVYNSQSSDILNIMHSINIEQIIFSQALMSADFFFL